MKPPSAIRLGLGAAIGRNSQIGDRVYRGVLTVAAISVLLIIIGLLLELVLGSRQSIGAFGLHFLTDSKWDPNGQHFGALPFILGTLYSSFWALVIALPISIFTAIFLSEIAPASRRMRWVERPVSFMVELLAAIPSVVYGLWGVLILQPWLVKYIESPIAKSPLSALPIFGDTANGYDMLAASLILAIMILPYITAVSRDLLRAIPRSVREGSYALGATRWETIKGVVLPYARAGIIGAVMLGFGRALGETMAVTMVIGNAPVFKTSLFSSGYTLSSVIANELAEASGLYRSALIEIGLCLFLITLVVNAGAKLLIYYTAKDLNATGGKV
ncbi:MAG: phosphate ABC transporter permease subunit PstC [Bacteroidota bacterium]|nr:phosphate ABC transporter permease subunit PstC [Bacteroidota bacterium]